MHYYHIILLKLMSPSKLAYIYIRTKSSSSSVSSASTLAAAPEEEELASLAEELASPAVDGPAASPSVQVQSFLLQVWHLDCKGQGGMGEGGGY